MYGSSKRLLSPLKWPGVYFPYGRGQNALEGLPAALEEKEVYRQFLKSPTTFFSISFAA